LVDQLTYLSEAFKTWLAGGRNLQSVLSNVRSAMDELGEAQVRHTLGGALTGAQNEGRLATAEQTDRLGLVIASEVNDANTCKPCSKIHGKILGRTDQMDEVRKYYPGRGFGGYVKCLGRERCRGTIRIKWQAEAKRTVGPPVDEDTATEIDLPSEPARPQPAPTRPDPPPQPGPSDARTEDLRRLIAREAEADQRLDRSGAQGLTEIVVLPGGRRFVSKRPRPQLDPDYPDVDREELANLVALAVGARVPALIRDRDDRLLLEFVDGDDGFSLGRAYGAAEETEAETEVYESDEGRLIGLLDVLIGNTDRHLGNFFVTPAGPVAIDHGYAWQEVGELGVPFMDAAPSAFAAHFIEDDPDADWTTLVRASNDMSAEDMAVIGDRLEALAPVFDQLGRQGWFQIMMERFAELSAAASGDRHRILG
jgi:hypothetical protein